MQYIWITVVYTMWVWNFERQYKYDIIALIGYSIDQSEIIRKV